MFLASTFMAAPLLLTAYLVESPRWLLATGRKVRQNNLHVLFTLKQLAFTEFILSAVQMEAHHVHPGAPSADRGPRKRIAYRSASPICGLEHIGKRSDHIASFDNDMPKAMQMLLGRQLLFVSCFCPEASSFFQSMKILARDLMGVLDVLDNNHHCPRHALLCPAVGLTRRDDASGRISMPSAFHGNPCFYTRSTGNLSGC